MVTSLPETSHTSSYYFDNTYRSNNINFQQSAELSELLTALAKAQGELGHANKNSVNPHFRSKYADLAEVIDTYRSVFATNGLSVVQRNFECKDGVVVMTTIFHSSGQWISDGGLHVPASKKDAQGVGSALTYARRYGLSSMIGIAPDEDDDGNMAVASTRKQTTQTTKNEPALSGEQRQTIIELSISCGATQVEAERTADATTVASYDRRISALKKRRQEMS